MCGGEGSEDGICRVNCDGTAPKIYSSADDPFVKAPAPPLPSPPPRPPGKPARKTKLSEVIDVDNLQHPNMMNEIVSLRGPDLPLLQKDKSKLEKYLEQVGTDFDINVGDLIVYGEADIEEHHRLGQVTAMETKDDHNFIFVKFQTFGASRCVFDVDSIRVHKDLAVPMDKYKLHDGKRFLYYGPPRRRYMSHHLYMGTKCVMLSDMSEPHVAMELNIGDIFKLRNPSRASIDLWCQVLGFLRHESIVYEWTILCYADTSKDAIIEQDTSTLQWERHLFGALTPQIIRDITIDTSEGDDHQKLFNDKCWYFDKVSYFLHRIDDMLYTNHNSTIMTLAKIWHVLAPAQKVSKKNMQETANESSVKAYKQEVSASNLASTL